MAAAQVVSARTLLRESVLVAKHQSQSPEPDTNGEAAYPRRQSGWTAILRRQKWVLVVTLFAAIVGGGIYQRVATPLYTSTIKLTVTSAGRGAPNASAAPAGSSASLGSSAREQITGDVVLAIAASNLGKQYNVKNLQDSLKVDLDRSSDNVSITAKNPSRDEAERIVTEVYKAFESWVSQPTQDAAKRDKERAEQHEKTKQLDAAIAKKEQEKLAFEKLHPVVLVADPYAGSSREAIRLREDLNKLQADLSTAQDEQAQADADLADAQKKLAKFATTQPATPADPMDVEGDFALHIKESLAMLWAEMAQVQAQLREAEQRYLPEHPTVVGLHRRAARLNRILLQSLDRQASQSAAKVTRLQKRINDASAELKRVDERLAGDSELKSQHQQIIASIKSLQTERSATEKSVQEIPYTGIDVRKFSGPSHAEKPSLPDPSYTYAVAVVLGLILGMLFAATREWFDDRMRSAGEIRSSLNMPLLAVIPQSTTRRSFSVLGQRVLLDPASDAAEAYRSLRTAIQFAAPQGVKTLMIASPNSGDGKTTLTTNLGIAMAQGGKRVCIVDADLRRPTIQDIFSIKTTLGLTTLLSGRSNLDGTLQKSPVSGLDILPCGPVPANPTEILNSQQFSDTLEELADRYDIVLLDSPPVQRATDARVIAASCDATLIVLTAKAAHRKSTEHTRDALQGVGARVIGLVVNDVPGNKSGNGYGTPKPLRTVVAGLTSQEYDILQTRVK
jgi:capsular exopolysaccharide synthesis family protein